MKNCTQLFSSYYTVASLATHIISEIKRYALLCAPNEDSDQSAYPLNMIRVFGGDSIGSQGPNVSLDRKIWL